VSFLQLCLSLAGIYVVATVILYAVLTVAQRPYPFWLALWGTTTLAVTMGFLGLTWGPLEDVQGLFSPTPLAYVGQVLFVIAMVFGTGRLLGALFDRISRKSGGSFQTGIVLLALSPIYSHSFVWGALYYLPGSTTAKTATVVASGYQHAGRSRQTHGDWVDVTFAGEQRKRHFISGQPYLLGSGNDACQLSAAHAGDTLNIEGRESPFGFAAIAFTPAQTRPCPNAP
jgi:hypothetical protein